MRLATVEEGLRIQIPVEWAEELGLEQVAALERIGSGILVTPVRERISWDELFREKLVVGKDTAEPDLTLTNDDLLF